MVDLTAEDSEEGKDVNTIKLTLHRGRVFMELIDYFLNDENIDYKKITVQMINNKGEKEKGVDDGGVFRDAISEFYNYFINRFTFGSTSEVVPVLKDEFGTLKWTAIARIIRKGYEQADYFPVFITKPFMIACIMKEENFDADYLLECLYNIIGPSSSETLKEAISNWEKFNTKPDQTEVQLSEEELLKRQEKEDDLMEILCDLNSDRKPKSGTHLREMLKEIAHLTIIQSPKFVIDTWQTTFVNLMPPEKITELYETRTCTVENVLRIIPSALNLSKEEDNIVGFLRRFIRLCSPDMRKKFLLFATGAMAVAVKQLGLVFTTYKHNLEVRFIAHTCGPVLEMPTNYSKFGDFRSDLEDQLAANYLVMDIA